MSASVSNTRHDTDSVLPIQVPTKVQESTCLHTPTARPMGSQSPANHFQPGPAADVRSRNSDRKVSRSEVIDCSSELFSFSDACRKRRKLKIPFSFTFSQKM